MYLIAILYGAATFAYLYYLARTTLPWLPGRIADHQSVFVVHLLSVIQLLLTTTVSADHHPPGIAVFPQHEYCRGVHSL
jgi:hypothetical protein